jgi:UDP-2,3-diacylglucosamine pyrophosphatase LpxH
VVSTNIHQVLWAFEILSATGAVPSPGYSCRRASQEPQMGKILDSFLWVAEVASQPIQQHACQIHIMGHTAHKTVRDIEQCRAGLHNS